MLLLAAEMADRRKIDSNYLLAAMPTNFRIREGTLLGNCRGDSSMAESTVSVFCVAGACADTGERGKGGSSTSSKRPLSRPHNPAARLKAFIGASAETGADS